MSSPNRITVTGEATKDVCPDEVRVTFGVETFDTKLVEATKKNETAAASLVAAIKKLGVKDCHIQMQALSVEIQYDHSGRTPIAACTGYSTRRSYTITLDKENIPKLEALITAGLNNGANRLSNFTSSVVDMAQIKQEVQRAAVKAARAKAEMLAGELGHKVGGALHIEEVDQPYGNTQRSFAAYGGGGEGAGSMPLGNVTVSAAVKIDFQLLV